MFHFEEFDISLGAVITWIKLFTLRKPPNSYEIGIQELKTQRTYEGGSICNENPFITPPTNALGIYAICQTKDQRVAVIMVYETIFYLSKFNKLQTL